MLHNWQVSTYSLMHGTIERSEVGAINCVKCHKLIKAGDEFRHRSDMLCEDCYIDARMDRNRKTHWQYLSCIKTQYLRRPDDA